MDPSTGTPASVVAGTARPAPPVHHKLPLLVRWALLAFAILCLVLGVIGVFVPGLPTTVFILMAAWAAARSSPRLHEWLRQPPLEMERYDSDDLVRSHSVCYGAQNLGCGNGLHIHGLRTGMALVSPRACLNACSKPVGSLFMYII